MNSKIEEFVTGWKSDNIHNMPGLESLHDEIARLTKKLIEDAAKVGITEIELSRSVGDIGDFLAHAYENVHDPEEGFRDA